MNVIISNTKHVSNAPSVVLPAGGYIKKTYLAPQPTCWLMRAEMREVHPVIVELLEGSGKKILWRLYILAGTSMIFKPDRLSMKAFWITNGIFAPLYEIRTVFHKWKYLVIHYSKGGSPQNMGIHPLLPGEGEERRR